MNDSIINKFLLAGDKFMPEMHLRQPQFVYSACGPFTRHKERIKKFKQTGDTRYIYRNELDKACFQHDSAYADHKDLINRTEADKVLRDKAYNVASNPEYDGYQSGLASMVYKFFDSKVSSGSGTKKDMTKSSSLILADELHKPVIRKSNKRKAYLQFKDNILGVDLADMKSLSKHNKSIKYLLCAIELFSKYAFFVPLKDKKGISIVNGFNKIIKMYYYVLDDTVSEYNNTKHNTIKMKPTDVGYDRTKSNAIARNNRVYIEEHNKKDGRFNVGDRVTIFKFKNIFAKGYTPNWSKEIFIVDKINDTVPYTYNIKDLNGEKIIGSFYDKELQKTIL